MKKHTQYSPDNKPQSLTYDEKSYFIIVHQLIHLEHRIKQAAKAIWRNTMI
jgi:hypothetical protein